MYELIIITVCIAAAVLTYELNVLRNKGPVKASAIVALFFGIPFYFASPAGILLSYAESVPAAAIGASFAGMSSSQVMPTRKWIAISGAIFSGIFLFSSPVFAGSGGGLGISAYVAITITLGIMKALSALKSRR